MLKDWNYPKEDRVWGSFYNLYLDKNLKVKELILNPKKGMSFQKHHHRNEIWFISNGSCIVNHSKNTEADKKEYKLDKEDIFFVKKNEWHQLANPYDEVCKIIEIQYGEIVAEEDIERLYFFEEKNK
ncbi:phosphomannose isomerase type II C-terminal cupin domain [Gammaproteobacteria bacterium]|nr:phosphomannose isomerase type II C-terminal cupin domain [Gammaproteobacteria bacterium]